MKRRVRPAFYFDITKEELWLLEHAGTEIADRWHEALWNALDFLQSHPFIGRQRHDIAHQGIRSWRIKDFDRWLIFYGVYGDIIVFYRVVPGAMNLASLRFY